MTLNVSIVGCGWLGLPLAEALIKDGHHVLGSTTSIEKLDILKQKGIDSALLKLNPMPEGKDFNKLFQADVIVINIPPKRRTNSPEFYREQIKYLKYQLQNSPIKKVIFISSTSYYPNANAEVDENTIFDINKGSNQAVVWGEQEISELKQELIILRCGGLMGNERIPCRWFSVKPTKGANTPVNYIHLTDIIKVVKERLLEGNWPSVQNLVNQKHLKRQEIVEAMAKKYGFESPEWIAPEETPFKKVKTLHKTDFKDPLTY